MFIKYMSSVNKKSPIYFLSQVLFLRQSETWLQSFSEDALWKNIVTMETFLALNNIDIYEMDDDVFKHTLSHSKP